MLDKMGRQATRVRHGVLLDGQRVKGSRVFSVPVSECVKSEGFGGAAVLLALVLTSLSAIAHPSSPTCLVACKGRRHSPARPVNTTVTTRRLTPFPRSWSACPIGRRGPWDDCRQLPKQTWLLPARGPLSRSGPLSPPSSTNSSTRMASAGQRLPCSNGAAMCALEHLPVSPLGTIYLVSLPRVPADHCALQPSLGRRLGQHRPPRRLAPRRRLEGDPRGDHLDPLALRAPPSRMPSATPFLILPFATTCASWSHDPCSRACRLPAHSSQTTPTLLLPGRTHRWTARTIPPTILASPPPLPSPPTNSASLSIQMQPRPLLPKTWIYWSLALTGLPSLVLSATRPAPCQPSLSARHVSLQARIITISESEKVAPPGATSSHIVEENNPAQLARAWQADFNGERVRHASGSVADSLSGNNHEAENAMLTIHGHLQSHTGASAGVGVGTEARSQTRPRTVAANVDIQNVFFEWVPPELIDFYLTEHGVRSVADVRKLSEALGIDQERLFKNI